MDILPDAEYIKKAYGLIRDKIHKTPVLTNKTINELAGAELFFKCENFQKVGAFKARGATHAIQKLTKKQMEHGVATHSSGNHAQALAYAAGAMNVKAYIVMPENAPAVKVKSVKGYGAEIFFCEPTLEARERALDSLVKKTSAAFIHPYNNYDVIAGQATVALELFDQVEFPDCLVAPAGGGGLLSGTCLSRNYFSGKTTIYGAEPSGADDACRSLKKGSIVPSVNPTTIADGLLTSLGSLTFPVLIENVESILTVDDEEIIDAMRLIWERMKIIVEPSAAVSLAVILKNQDIFKGKKTGIILSGGNVDLDHLPFHQRN